MSIVSVGKRKRNIKKKKKNKHLITTPFWEKVLVDHGLLGLFNYSTTHPFTRASRLLVLLVEININFMAAVAMVMVAAKLKDDPEVKSLRDDTYNTGDYILSFLVGKSACFLFLRRGK